MNQTAKSARRRRTAASSTSPANPDAYGKIAEGHELWSDELAALAASGRPMFFLPFEEALHTEQEGHGRMMFPYRLSDGEEGVITWVWGDKGPHAGTTSLEEPARRFGLLDAD
jgi:hypothetical protein